MPSGSRSTPASSKVRRAWQFSMLVGVVAAVVGGCSAGSTSESNPGQPDALEVLTQPSATAMARTVIGTAPVVQVVDDAGDPVAQAGITINAIIQTGGGTLSGTTAVQTDAQGQATFANLSIAGLVGTKVLRFTSTGLTGINASGITLTAGPAANLVASSSTNQNTLIGTAVTAKPAVRATDQDGNAVAGVAVTFAITQGAGSMSGGAQVTNAQGIATVGSWTVDANAGTNTMTATSGALNGSPVTFTAVGVTSISNFTIELVFLTAATPAQQTAFTAAKARWEEIISGDLADFTIPVAFNTTDCGANVSSQISGTIDDVRIYVELGPIDGPDNILGAAGPCDLRGNGTRLPYVGLMNFDTADLPALEADGDLNDVILHEMGHVLGYGTLWEPITGFWPTNFLTGSCPASTPAFTGAGAVNAFTSLNGGNGTTVPVEDSGTCTGSDGDGTRDSHWEESIFRSELMTGFISGTVRPMSATTIRSIEDLGYTVNVAAADPFNLATQPTLRAPGSERVRHLKGDVLRLPVFITDPATGRRRAIRR